jgi:hypothetical protein
MTVDQIRALRNAQPFKPFTLMLDDGRQFHIEASYYLGISPREDLVLAVSRDRGTAWFAPERVKEARIMRMVAG